MKRRARPIRLLLILIGLAIIASLVFTRVVYPMVWSSQVERDSIGILRAASTELDLADAVGDLGIFIVLPDRNWIAIRYRDSHAARRSFAVARCSDGSWYTSDHHFCGRFRIYERLRNDPTRRNSDAWHEDFQDIHAVAESLTFPDAKRALEAMPFQPFTP